MSFTKNYGDQFLFAGHEVEVEFETLPGEAASLVRDFIRKGNHGQAEIAVLGAATQSLTVDGQKVIKKSQKKGGMGNVHLPSIMDRTSFESLTDRLLKMIVAEEWWLAKKEPFDEVFEQYMEDEDEEAPGKQAASNPTQLHTGEKADG